MNPELLEADARARKTLRSDFENTLFVDAGAGTGKTTAIVERIAELVANGRINMSQLVAITFTEAAAAELRTRVREAASGRPCAEARRAGCSGCPSSRSIVRAGSAPYVRSRTERDRKVYDVKVAGSSRSYSFLTTE